MIRTWWSSFEVEVRFKEFQWSEQVVVCLLLQVGSTKTHMVVEFRGGGQFRKFQWSEQVVIRRLLEVCSTKNERTTHQKCSYKVIILVIVLLLNHFLLYLTFLAYNVEKR